MMVAQDSTTTYMYMTPLPGSCKQCDYAKQLDCTSYALLLTRLVLDTWWHLMPFELFARAQLLYVE